MCSLWYNVCMLHCFLLRFSLSECFLQCLTQASLDNQSPMYGQTYVHAYICTDVNTHLHAYIWYIHAYTYTKLSYSTSVFWHLYNISSGSCWHSSAPYPTDCSCSTKHIQWTTLKCNHYYSIDSEVVLSQDHLALSL